MADERAKVVTAAPPGTGARLQENRGLTSTDARAVPVYGSRDSKKSDAEDSKEHTSPSTQSASLDAKDLGTGRSTK